MILLQGDNIKLENRNSIPLEVNFNKTCKPKYNNFDRFYWAKYHQQQVPKYFGGSYLKNKLKPSLYYSLNFLDAVA